MPRRFEVDDALVVHHGAHRFHPVREMRLSEYQVQLDESFVALDYLRGAAGAHTAELEEYALYLFLFLAL